MKLSSKRNGKDTYFWIIFFIDETERMLFVLWREVFSLFSFAESVRRLKLTKKYQVDGMRYFILTNNPMAVDRFASSHEVCFVQGTLMDVLVHARDQIHNGAVLLTHPLYGSVKPNETPYRSLLLGKKRILAGNSGEEKENSNGCIPDAESVRLIGNAISTARKFIDKKEITDPRLLNDFQVVDLSLLESAVESADR